MGWKQQPAGRSLQCNGETIRHHREHHGWTQQQLAQRAGYSARVVAKAEANGTLRPDTIDHLADALSTAARPVHPEDLVFSPKAIARQIMENYARYEKDCSRHCHEFLADDFELIVPGDASVLPFCGTYHGRDGFDKFWENFFSVMERHDKDIILRTMRVFAEGNNVVIFTRECGSFVGQPGPHTSTPLAFLFEFERGKLKRMEDHFNAAAAEERVRELLTYSRSARDALRDALEGNQSDGQVDRDG
ncbi:nuclear transport factor 2 family protein [Aeoliella sp.]|uniref:nuclear transport factor 2 family protein n=1 Tax=Aeoliella sp. TaxID=2795800 RepID=UPI003CCC31B8